MLLRNGLAYAKFCCMRFLDYYKTLSPAEKIDFAQRVDSSVAYLSQLAHGHRRPGGAMLLAIIRESDGCVAASIDSFGRPPAASTQAAPAAQADAEQAA